MDWTPERIRQLRRQYGETQEAFARRCRVSLRTVAAWEAGRPPEGSALALFDLLAGQPTAPKKESPDELARREELRKRLGVSK